MTSRTADEYNVGYGKPPSETKFKKGVSGNPGGRPKGMTAMRANRLALKVAYRQVTVREGDKARTMTAMEAMLLSMMASAAKGNVAAQRALLEIVQTIEQDLAAQQHTSKAGKPIQQEGRFSGNELARRIAFLLRTAGNTEA